MTESSSHFVLLDRDGVLNVDRPHSVRDRSEFELIDGAAEGVRRMNEKGYQVIVVTNQACVGRGDLAPDELNAIHEILHQKVSDAGGEIAGIYVCPHVDADECRCRKPSPGLLKQAYQDHGFDLSETFFVGDDERDMKAAKRAGARPAVVRTGKGTQWEPPAQVPVFEDVMGFAKHLVSVSQDEAARPMNVAQVFAEHVEVIRNLKSVIPDIEAAADRLIECVNQEGTVFWMGNGGSAADSQHLAAEFVGRFRRERPAFASVALTTDTSVLTAVGNDYGFETVFRRQVEALCEPDDILIGISTSGNSENVLQAIDAAKEIGAYTMGLTGRRGGKLGEYVDTCLKVPSHETTRIQEGHILIGHVLCEHVERAITAKS